MRILFETNKFHHGEPPCSGGPRAIAPLPFLNPALDVIHSFSFHYAYRLLVPSSSISAIYRRSQFDCADIYLPGF